MGVTSLLLTGTSVGGRGEEGNNHTGRYGTTEGATVYALCHSPPLTCGNGGYCNNSAEVPGWGLGEDSPACDQEVSTMNALTKAELARQTIQCEACSYNATYTSQADAWAAGGRHEDRHHDGAMTCWTLDGHNVA